MLSFEKSELTFSGSYRKIVVRDLLENSEEVCSVSLSYINFVSIYLFTFSGSRIWRNYYKLLCIVSTIFCFSSVSLSSFSPCNSNFCLPRDFAAALKVLSYLPLPYSALSMLMVVPTPLRDAVYDYIAKRRYDWFGKAEDCLVMKEKELLERFIDREEMMGNDGSGSTGL